MNFYEIDYPNSTKLIVKTEGDLSFVARSLMHSSGVKWFRTVYNPQSFLSVTQVMSPSDRYKQIAQELSTVLIGL